MTSSCWSGISRFHIIEPDRRVIKMTTVELITTPCDGYFNTLRPRQNGRHFADALFKGIFLNGNVWIPIKFSLKFVRKGPINNIPALVQKMTWRRPGDKPLSGPMMVSLLTHICVTRPQWVNKKTATEEHMQRNCDWCFLGPLLLRMITWIGVAVGLANVINSALTHWGCATPKCVSKQTIIGQDNSVSPSRRQTIIWTSAGILLIRTIETKFSEIVRAIRPFSFTEMQLKKFARWW